jgi:hypothetical protein
MKVIRDRPESIGEFAELGVHLSSLVSTIDILPAIIEYNVGVTQIPQAQSDDLLRGGIEKIFRNIAAKSVPVVLLPGSPRSATCLKESGRTSYPSHRRRHG